VYLFLCLSSLLLSSAAGSKTIWILGLLDLILPCIGALAALWASESLKANTKLQADAFIAFATLQTGKLVWQYVENLIWFRAYARSWFIIVVITPVIIAELALCVFARKIWSDGDTLQGQHIPRDQFHDEIDVSIMHAPAESLDQPYLDSEGIDDEELLDETLAEAYREITNRQEASLSTAHRKVLNTTMNLERVTLLEDLPSFTEAEAGPSLSRKVDERKEMLTETSLGAYSAAPDHAAIINATTIAPTLPTNPELATVNTIIERSGSTGLKRPPADDAKTAKFRWQSQHLYRLEQITILRLFALLIFLFLATLCASGIITTRTQHCPGLYTRFVQSPMLVT
jgi:hypothetical protein